MNKILVTGGAGYIGSKIVVDLIKQKDHCQSLLLEKIYHNWIDNYFFFLMFDKLLEIYIDLVSKN